MQLIKNHPAVGWVRGDLIPDESAAAEILRLRQKLEKLEGELMRSSNSPPPGSEVLAQDEDIFAISCFYFPPPAPGSGPFATRGPRQQITASFSWNNIFGTLAPMLIDEASEREMRARLNQYIEETNPWVSAGQSAFDGISETSFEKIKVQLRALGLINKSARSHSLKDDETYWTLTPYGDAAMTKIHAIRRV